MCHVDCHVTCRWMGEQRQLNVNDRKKIFYRDECEVDIKVGWGWNSRIPAKGASEWVEGAHHSSEDEESVKVGVGLLLRFLVLPSSTEATASLSALRLAYEVDATGGGGDIELPFGFLLCNVLSMARSFSSCSRRMLSKKSPRRTR